jgi:hypothetical protein
VPLGSEEVPTHWGNSHLTFSLYQRVARWVLDADSTERVSDRATLAALERGEIDPPASAPSQTKRSGNRRKRGGDGAAEASTPPLTSEAQPKSPRSPNLATSPGLVSRLLRTVV